MTEWILAWRLIADSISIYECLALFCVCQQFNQLYSEDDWVRMMTQHNFHPPEESEMISSKRRFMIAARANFRVRLRIIRESSTENILKTIDYSNYGLIELRGLYVRSVRDEVERDQKMRQDSLNRMYSLVFEQITPEMRENPEIRPIYELFVNLQQTISDPVKAMNEIQRWLEEEHPEYKPMVTQVAQQYPLLCPIL